MSEAKTEPKAYVQFRADMQEAGFDVREYRGRFYYEGPAVETDRENGPCLQEIQRATRVKVQYDNLGLDLIVYPTKTMLPARAESDNDSSEEE